MDFGDILDDWDRRTAKSAGKKAIKAARYAERAEGERPAEDPGSGGRPAAPENRRVDPLTAWLRVNPISDKDEEEAAEHRTGSEFAADRRRLRSKAPDASIDLHGLTRDEALARLESFFADALRHRLEKVRIVHGKGNHSEGEAVLKRATRDFIERNPYAGESGACVNKSGGSGATWVLLKNR